MIALTGVQKHYSGYPQAVLQNINLRINKGEFVYVVGDSGAGKSTLLKLLYGEEAPTRGTIEIFGQNLSRIDRALLQNLRRRIGVIFQDLRLIEELDCFDNIALSLEFAGITGNLKQLISEALSSVGLSRVAKKKVSLLSGGERSRVASARAIARKPELIIADEPTGSLDQDQTWSLMDLYQKMHLRGTTVLFATHDREIVRRVRKRACVLTSGKMTVEEGICIF